VTKSIVLIEDVSTPVDKDRISGITIIVIVIAKINAKSIR